MTKIAFIGAGSMAEAIIAGLIENKLLKGQQIFITNRSNRARLTELQNNYGITPTYDTTELLKDAEIVILAMKPKDAEAAIQDMKEKITNEMLIVSVLAGVSIASIETFAQQALPVVRAMPNTSAAIGHSATALAANQLVTEAQKQQLTTMFETIGLATFVKEEQLDAITGLSGSGPAYIYYVVEALEKAAAEIGLEKEVAKQFIVQTLLGAGEMLKQSPKSAQQLRHDVMSPGGTTEAGIRVLEAHNVEEAFIACVKEATAQSKRLGAMWRGDTKQ